MAGEIIQYQTEDGVTVIRLQARDGNVWLSQAEIAELFQVTPQAIKLGDHPLLAGAGRIQAKAAAKKVDAEFDAWHARAINAPSAVEQHFVEAVGRVKAIEAEKPKERNVKGGGRRA